MINRDKSKREQNDVTNLQYYSINDTVVQVTMTTREGKLAAKKFSLLLFDPFLHLLLEAK